MAQHEEESAGHLFLSYAAVDRERALTVADVLEAAGVAVWIDRRGIAGGDLWASEISAAIRNCAALAILCTAASVTSRNVRQELQLAWDYDRPIVPLMLETVQFPPEIAYFLHGRQWIDILAIGDGTWVAQVSDALIHATPPAEDHSAALSSKLQHHHRGDGGSAIPSVNRLPSTPSSLVGRDVEVKELTAFLEGTSTRIVTLTGPGGVGKTRLALEVAHQVAGAFEDGAAFVDLAPLSDPASVPGAIASALGLRDTVGRPIDEVLADYLRGRRYLLVVDNFEHLLAAATVPALLLRECPGLVMIATSREPLRIRGEREWLVDPLPVPETGIDGSFRSISESEAVSLFVERSRDVRPNFSLTESNASEIAEICRRLDGLPLAIELAAARTRLLSPASLLARLESRLGILTEGARDAPNRQQTLRDTVAWSYDLLAMEEQEFFRKASIFTGGFTLESVEAVAIEPGDDALALITSLAEKNLLRQNDGSDGEPRFMMLETIREFGLELLNSANDDLAVRQRHYDYFLRLASEKEGDLFATNYQVSWYIRLDAEIANLRSAWNWSYRNGDIEATFRLLVASAIYWTTRPFDPEIVRLLEEGLAADLAMPSGLLVEARFMATLMSGMTGDFDRTFAHAAAGLVEANKSGDPYDIGRAHIAFGIVWESVGDCEKSARANREGLAAFRQAPESIWLPLAAGELGERLLLCGDVEEGVRLIDEAIMLNRRLRAGWGLAIAFGQRGHGARIQGDTSLARRMFGESITASERVGDRAVLLGAVVGLAGVELLENRVEQAARMLGAVERARESFGLGRIGHSLHVQQIIGQVSERLGEAEYQRLFAEGRTIPYEQLISEALTPSKRNA